jgi:ATP-dependent DNA ligase
VLINPESLHKGGRSHKWKVKPFHTVDIVVTELKEGHSGKVPLFEVHGYDTKTGEIVKITSGISPEMFAEMKRAEQQFAAVIVEAELSSLKDLKSANATLLGIRYDKMESLNQDAEPRPISLPSICCSKGGSSAISI